MSMSIQEYKFMFKRIFMHSITLNHQNNAINSQNLRECNLRHDIYHRFFTLYPGLLCQRARRLLSENFGAKWRYVTNFFKFGAIWRYIYIIFFLNLFKVVDKL